MKRLPAILLAASILACGGCLFSNNKPAPKRDPKQGPHVAKDAEMDFRQRWVDKRTTDLIAQGAAPDDARSQALAEFRTKFSYTEAASMP